MILKLHMTMQRKGIEGLSSSTKHCGDSSYANLSVARAAAPAAGLEHRTSLQSTSFPSSLTAAQKTCLLSGRVLAAGRAWGELLCAQKSYQHRKKLKAAQPLRDLLQPITAGRAQSSSSALGNRKRVSPPQHPQAVR